MTFGDLHNPGAQGDLVEPGRDCSVEHCWLCHLRPLSSPWQGVWQSGLGVPWVHAGPGRTTSGAAAAPRVEVLNLRVRASQDILRCLRTPNGMQNVLSRVGGTAFIRIPNRAMTEELVPLVWTSENQP